MLDQFNLLDVDTQKATLSAVSIVAILLALCCISQWILWGFTALFSIFAGVLAYKQFIEPKRKGKPLKS